MKLMKRTVSVFLAILMLFGSFSVLASAEVVGGYGDTISFDMKFYRNTGTEDAPVWTETTKAAPGDSIRARFFIDTDFVVGSSEMFFLYNKKAIVMDPTLYVKPSNSYTIVSNTTAGSVSADSGITGAFTFSTEQTGVGDDLVYYGNLPEGTFDEYGFAYFAFNNGKASKWSGDDWMFELHYTVAENPVGTAQIYMPIETVITATDDYNNWDAAATRFGRLPESSAGGSMAGKGYEESYDWDPVVINNDKDEDSTLTFNSKITFNANGGTLAGDAVSTGYIKSAATAPAVTAPAGSEFIGWVPADKELTEENVVTTFAYDYEDTAYTALYTAAAPTTANYTVNVYTMGTDGVYGAPAVETLVGNIDEEVTYTPAVAEGFYLDAAQSTLTTTVAADGSAVINAYIARNAMTVKYVDDKGAAISTLPDATYYYGATYEIAPAINKVGYVWTGWEAGKTVEAKPATNGEVVTYEAAYEAGDNKVVINAFYDDEKFGGTVDLEPYTVATKTGYTVKIVNEIPAAPEANVTYVLKSALPAAEHYEVDPDAEYTVEVLDDGSAALEIAYVSKMYTVTFLDANGDVLYTGKHPYYDAVDAPGASDLGEQGQTFVAWEIIEGVGADLDDEYATIMVEGNVTYQALYENIEYYAFFASEEVDGFDAPSLEDMGLTEEEIVYFGDEIVLPDVADKFVGYEFLGYDVYGAEYDEETNTVTVGTEDVDIIAKWDMIEYTANYYLTDDTTADPYLTVEYHYGDEIEGIEAPAKEGYDFTGWAGYTDGMTMPAEDVDFTATWKVNEYTVTWNVDGVKTEETYAYGATIVKPADPAKEGYTFAGWSPAVPATQGAADAEYVAQWTVDEYTVTWDVDGVKTTETYAYGATITKPADPAKEGYTFTGWAGYTDGMTMPADDQTFTATWDVNTDTVTWDVDGALTEETYEYGAAIVKPADPAKEGYTFAGWTPAVPATQGVGDATYTATWIPAGNSYKVETYLMDTEGKFSNVPTSTEILSAATDTTVTAAHVEKTGFTPATEGNVLEGVVAADGSTTLMLYYVRNQYTFKTIVDGAETAETYYYEAAVAAPAAPEKVGYDFAGWDGSVPATMPAEDVTLTATWTAQNFTVTWDVDGVTTVETYAYGAEIAKKEAPVKEGNTFAGWDGYTDGMTMPAENVTFTATWTANNYTVTWDVDGATTEETYAYGAEIVAPAAPEKAGYNFAGWEGYAYGMTMPAANQTFTATWTPKNYTAKWDVDGAITEETYAYGAAINEMAAPAKEGYTFAGWEGYTAGMTMPIDGVTFTAKWSPIIYTVEWDIDGVKTTETYAYGEAIVAPAAPTKEGHTFAGWEGYTEGMTMPVDGVTFKATWTVNNYTVTWDVDGVTTEETYAYGAAINEMAAPADKEGYTFAGWAGYTDGMTMPAENLTFTAEWAANNYTVTWVVDGVETTETVAYGAEIVAPAAPTKAGYVFAGWEGYTEGMTMPVDGVTFKATWTAEEYDVVFMINDTVYASAKAAFGTEIANVGTPDAAYIPEGYSFKGWSTDGATVITDFGTVAVGGNTFYAVLEVNNYTLTFVVDGETVKTETVAYGAAITAPTAPNKEADGLTFAGWVDADDESKMPAKMPAKNATYVAKYVDSGATADYTVEVYHMDINGDYELTATTTLSAHVGESVAVTAGTVKGFTFDADESVLNGKVVADGSTTLKVCYARNLYTATFDGVDYEVYFGAALPVVEPAAKDGQTFIGWTPAVPASMPAEDLTFTSEWEEAKYVITYYVNGETTEEEYVYGAEIEIPADPTVEGMEFTGWTGLPADGKMPAKDIIVIANFKAAVYNVTFKNADGSVFEKKAVKFGEEIIVPTTEPTLEYHNFIGWSGLPADGKMPANDVEVTPIFEAIPVMLIPKNADCTTVIDRNGETTADYDDDSTWYIYGLQEILKDEDLLNDYIDVQGDGRIEIVYNEYSTGKSFAPWTGTGTVINVYNNETDELVESFTIVIFGDLNGDSYVTATDWSMAEDEVAYYTEWSDETSSDYCAYRVMAADFDKNGVIMPADAASISNATLGLSEIDQVEGKVIDL